MRQGREPWLASHRRGADAGWRSVLRGCDAPRESNSAETRGKALKAQPVFSISGSY